MTRPVSLLLWLGLLTLPGWRVLAQTDIQAYFTSENGSPLVGEPIDVTFTVDAPADAVLTFPNFATEWPPFTVQQVGELTSTSSGTRTIYNQRLSITLWRSGDYQTPETIIEYRLTDGSVPQQRLVQPAFFTVKSILNPDDLNLRSLKPPVSVLYVSPLVIAAIVLGFVALGVLLWSRRKSFTLPKIAPEPNGLHPAAQAALSAIKRNGGSDAISPKIYAVVSDALRHYLHGRFDVPAVDMTTQELMVNLSARELLLQRRQRELLYLLEQADLVKFARMQPPPTATEKMMTIASAWVLAVEREQAEVDA